MSSYSRFKELNQLRQKAEQRRNTTFVFTAENSIDLTLFHSSDTKVRASVVNQQEKDQAYIYTELNEPLQIGSIWGAKGLNWLIAEEIVIIKDVNWHKYLAFLCNVELDDLWGYFLGPEKNFVNVTLREKTVLQSLQHPVLMVPGQPFNINDKLVIKNRGWLIQEMDNISTAGITYYSLRETTISKPTIAAQEVVEEPYNVTPSVKTFPEIHHNFVEIGPNVPLTIKTIDGYFNSTNRNIKIIHHTATEVTFSIPFGVSETTISYKENNEIKTKKVKVV